MTEATFVAQGAAAIGLMVFVFCIFVAVNAKKQQGTKASKQDTTET